MKIIQRIDKTNAVIAFMVWLTVFFIYNLTKAPTFSLWDCAEFVAVCNILGIPHPPGTPLYVIIGRLFAILPISADIAVRINLLSVISSAFSAMFAYLAAVRILRACLKEKTVLNKIIIYAGSVCGTFFLAFSFTNWNNSVEAEVYGLSMMIFNAIFWLVLIYNENRGTPLADRIMLLIFFLAFVGINAHLSTYLVIPAIVFFFILKKDAAVKTWFILAGLVVFVLYLVFAMSSKPGEIPYYLPVTITFLFYIFYIFSFEKILYHYLIVAGGFLLSILPIIGLTVASSADADQSVFDTLQYIGVVSYIALILYGLYLSNQYRIINKQEEIRKHYLIAAIFIFISALMVLILFLLKGYSIFLIITAILMIGVLFVIRKDINWIYFIAIGSASLVIIGVKPFIYGIIAASVLIIVGGLLFKHPHWKNGLLIILVAILGYSINIYTPIRSAQKPTINENDPSQSWSALVSFIERKQYGSQSMTERMFERRAEWKNQFGNHRRMGFWMFFKEQYGFDGLKFIFPFVIGIFGIWETIRRKGKIGIPLLLIIIITSVGLVLYMNFADGTRQLTPGRDHLEVRDRDYFFTPAYMFFGLAIGLGIAYLIQFLNHAIKHFNPTVRKIVAGSSFVLFLMPTFAIAGNYYLCDRSQNYIPYDYAHNLLYSAEKNAVLFTAGDNDTFSLWCIQEAYDYRKDVAVVNTALANLEWYIRQLRDNLGVKLSWTDSQIRNLRPFRDQNGNFHNIGSQVMSDIIKENFGKRPINFSITVPPGKRLYMGKSLDSLLTLNGLTWRMTRQTEGMKIDVDATYDFLIDSNKFRHRSIVDTNVYKDEVSLRITRNYSNAFIQAADSLRKAGDLVRVENLLIKAVESIPHATATVEYLTTFYANLNEDEKLTALIETDRYAGKRRLKSIWAQIVLNRKDYDKAELILKELIAENPDYKPPVENLIRLYLTTEQPEKILDIARGWLANHPDDVRMRSLIDVVLKEINRNDSL